jgi:ABC-type multidrug transport system fused ATPase/permease subunit
LFDICLDPILFTGTIQYNLDPFSNHTETKLWSVLESVNLSNKIQSLSGGLNYFVNEGENLSVGERYGSYIQTNKTQQQQQQRQQKTNVIY